METGQLANAVDERETARPRLDSSWQDALSTTPPVTSIWDEQDRQDILLLPELSHDIVSPLEDLDLLQLREESPAPTAPEEETTTTAQAGIRIITWQDDPELFAQILGTPAAPPVEETVASDDDLPDEEDWDLSGALDDLAQEVRRVGREVFKANRATQRNQEMFEQACGQMEQLALSLARLEPPQSHPAAPGADVVFQAKASICRDLLRMSDVLEASLQTAADVVIRLDDDAQEALLKLQADAALLRLAPATKEQTPPPPGRLQALWQRLTGRHKTVVPAAESSDNSEAPTSPEDAVTAALTGASQAMQQWLDGQELIYQRLQAVLETAGARPIKAVGNPFDTTLHRAVAVESSDTRPDGYVVGEELKGYTLDGKVLRYAEVVVARRQEM